MWNFICENGWKIIFLWWLKMYFCLFLWLIHKICVSVVIKEIHIFNHFHTFNNDILVLWGRFVESSEMWKLFCLSGPTNVGFENISELLLQSTSNSKCREIPVTLWFTCKTDQDKTSRSITCLSLLKTGGALSRRVDKTLSFQMANLSKTLFLYNVEHVLPISRFMC